MENEQLDEGSLYYRNAIRNADNDLNKEFGLEPDPINKFEANLYKVFNRAKVSLSRGILMDKKYKYRLNIGNNSAWLEIPQDSLTNISREIFKGLLLKDIKAISNGGKGSYWKGSVNTLKRIYSKANGGNMINEGQFETAAKTIINNTKIEKELVSLGLGYNGGDPIYSNNKKNATIASWELIPNKKIMNLLRTNGEFSYPLSHGNEYYLLYNIRTKKFAIERYFWALGKNEKRFNPVEIKNPEVLSSPIFKRLEEIAVQMKRNTQVVFTGGHRSYKSAMDYGENHLVKEDVNYFNY